MSSPIRLHDSPDTTTMRPRSAICTLGCKLNQADESDLRRELRNAGLSEVPFSEPTGVYNLNTCTVTHLADRRSRHMMRCARRRNDRAIVAAIGCYPQVAPDEHVLASTMIPRVRLTSGGPHEIDSRFIDILQHPRMMPHLHMALQRSSPTVLKRMKRWYNLHQYRRSIRYLREAISDIRVTTDVIVGFPGETDEEFRETCDFVQEIGFSKLHVFPLSVRRKTAAEMPDRVQRQIKEYLKEHRPAEIRQRGERLSREFLQQQTGQHMSVVVESRGVSHECRHHWCSGFSGNYARVYRPGSYGVDENQIVTTQVIEPFRASHSVVTAQAGKRVQP